MIRRITIVGLVSLLLLNFCLYAENPETPPSNDEVGVAITVIMDCISASLVTSCTPSNINLPCSNVSINPQTNLPIRISYFLADPFEYVKALAPPDSSGGFFSSLLSLLNSAAGDPLVTSVYVVMAARGYTPGGYLLSGNISFSFPEGVFLDDVINIWSSREDTGQSIYFKLEMRVYGTELDRPLSVSGEFDMSVDSDGGIVIKSVDIYKINGYGYRGGEFRF
ncbi:MAG: hypothetical protein ACTTJW_01585 [Sphaerochaeta sp.]